MPPDSHIGPIQRAGGAESVPAASMTPTANSASFTPSEALYGPPGSRCTPPGRPTISRGVLRLELLSPTAKLVLAVSLAHPRRNPSGRQLADALGLGRERIRAAQHELEATGLATYRWAKKHKTRRDRPHKIVAVAFERDYVRIEWDELYPGRGSPAAMLLAFLKRLELADDELLRLLHTTPRGLRKIVLKSTMRPSQAHQ